MGGYEELIAGIKDVVRRNGRREITGDALQQVLVGMVSAIGANSAFAGVANPETDPGSPDANVFWIAAQPGTYTHFGNAVVTTSAVLSNETGEWVATPLNFGEPRPFPDFYLYSGVGSTHYTTRENISVDGKGDFTIQIMDSYLNVGLDHVSEQETRDLSMTLYPYRGRGNRRGFFPFRRPYPSWGVIPFDSRVHPYKYGCNINTPLTMSNNVLTLAGLYAVGGNIIRSSIDSIGAALKGEELPEFWLRAYGDSADSRRIKILNSDIFTNLTDKAALAKLRYPIPLITVRMGARLFRGEEAGPMKIFRLGIYVVDPRTFAGNEGFSDADIYIRMGRIRELDRAYNNGKFL